MKTLNEKQLKDINGGKGIVGEVTGEVTSIGNAISNGWHDLKQSVADTTKQDSLFKLKKSGLLPRLF